MVKLETKIERNKIICGYTITIPFFREQHVYHYDYTLKRVNPGRKNFENPKNPKFCDFLTTSNFPSTQADIAYFTTIRGAQKSQKSRDTVRPFSFFFFFINSSFSPRPPHYQHQSIMH